MSTTNALNVVGSIGSTASSVGSLATSVDDFLQSLTQASYGNVKFGVEGVRTSAGRKTAVHAYPFRDEVWIEDLGKKGRQFEIQGFLVENDLKTGAGSVIEQRNSLLQACETAGGQTLVHPTLGTVKNVCCIDVELTERRDLGRVFEFRLTLAVTGPRLFPSSTTSTPDASTASAGSFAAAATAASSA